MYKRILARKRRRRNREAKVKTFMTVLAVTLLLGSTVGGTVAWLTSVTDPVINTFTYGDINIELSETDTDIDNDNDSNTNQYTMTPGELITKDPKVTVKADSEDCWLFVKLVKSENFDQFMEYTVLLDDPATDAVDGWSALEGVGGVYYRKVDKASSDTEYYVIKDNTVNVKNDVTKEMLNALDKDLDGSDKADADKTYPTLTVTAYAVQRDGDIDAIDTAAEAWALAAGQGN